MIFWIEIIAGIILAIPVLVAVMFDVFWPLSIAVLAAVCVQWKLGGLRWFLYLWHPAFIGLYVLFGIGWIFFRWMRLVEKEFRRAESLKIRTSLESDPPKWADHGYDYMAYFVYWPVDMLGWVLSDFLRDCWNLVSKMISKSFDDYAAWRFAQLKAKQESK